MTALADSLAAYTADALIGDESPRVRTLVQRAYMAGALQPLTKPGPTREQLLAEIVMYGRAIGSAVERA